MRSETIAQLATALSKAQGEFPEIPKNTTVKVKTKTGGEYSYDYAPLDVVLKTTRPALTKNELAIIQRVDEGDEGALLEVTLVHSSGEFITSCKTLGRIPDVKQFGSAMTYYRRYLIEGLLGVASEKDDDGERAPAQAQATNGNGHKKARTSGDFKNWINDQLPEDLRYESVNHLRNAIRKHCDLPEFEFPGKYDTEDWAETAKLGKELVEVMTTDQTPTQDALIETDQAQPSNYEMED